MKKSLLILVAATLIFQSCKKDDEEQTPPDDPSYSTFLPLKTGNYWIYEWFNIDTNNVATPMDKVDSIYVSKDTTIHNDVFYKLEGTFLGSGQFLQIVRDSLHYLVSHDGTILFSSEDFSNTLHIADTVGNLFYLSCKMEDQDFEINVPAGNFLTSDYRQTVHQLDSNYQWGDRYLHNRYAEDIGRVLFSTFYFSSPNYMEARLVNYHVEE